MTTQGFYESADSLAASLNEGDTFYVVVPGEQAYSVGTFVVTRVHTSTPWVAGNQVDEQGNIIEHNAFAGYLDEYVGTHGLSRDPDVAQLAADRLNDPIDIESIRARTQERLVAERVAAEAQLANAV